MADCVTDRIEAIFFDMNGTLRERESDAPTREAALTRLLSLLGKDHVSVDYWDEMTRHFKAYGEWAQANLVQLPEEEVWTRWILPDEPRERVAPVAAELTLAWSERKGRAVPREGARETLVALKRRGFRLGVISNTLSTLDIPRFLECYGWTDLFNAVILSSVIRHRKPSPEPFLIAARALNIQPVRCAYVGNRIAKDLPGCKRAGYGMGILIAPPDGSHLQPDCSEFVPDMVIHSLPELLPLFQGVPHGISVIS